MEASKIQLEDDGKGAVRKTTTLYRPFPTDQLPEGMRSFVEVGAKAIGCDPANLALPALCVCAGILGGSRRLLVKSSWLAPPILWGCVLGESGTSKSPAMRLAMEPLRERGRIDYERWEASLKPQPAATASVGQALPGAASGDSKDAKVLASTTSPKVTSKPPRRVLVADTTTEALALIAKENPLGLLLGRDELAGLFGGFDRYAGKSGGDEAFFLSAFDGESVTVDRKTAREHVYVRSMSLSIVGTCQPAVFGRLMTSQRRESGMLARFLVVHPPMKSKLWSDTDVDPSIEAGWAFIVNRLLDLEFAADAQGSPTPFLISRSEEAYSLYRDFFNAHNASAMDETGDWRAFLAKAEQLPLRLALVLHHVRWAQSAELEEGFDPAQVDAATMANAIALTHWFIGEARRVYVQLSSAPEERMQAELEEWIRRRGGKTTVREVMRLAPQRFRASESLVSGLLSSIEKTQRGKWVDVVEDAQGGLPPLGGFVARHFELV